MDRGSFMSVYSTKTSGCCILQISLHGSKQVTKRVKFETNDYDGQCHYNKYVWKSKIDYKQIKIELPMIFLTNAG